MCVARSASMIYTSCVYPRIRGMHAIRKLADKMIGKFKRNFAICCGITGTVSAIIRSLFHSVVDTGARPYLYKREPLLESTNPIRQSGCQSTLSFRQETNIVHRCFMHNEKGRFLPHSKILHPFGPRSCGRLLSMRYATC